MYLPALKQKRAQQAVTSVFGGINRAEEIPDGQFRDALNLSTREYPMLCPRKPRGIGEETAGVYRGIMEKNGKLVEIIDGTVYYGGSAVPGITLSQSANMQPKQMVSMGAYVVIFPDKVYFNSIDMSDKGSLEASYASTGNVTYTMCRLDGSDFGNVTQGPEAPEDPDNGAYWLNTGETPHKLMMYSSMTGLWSQIMTVYTRITAAGIDDLFQPGDTVELSGISADAYTPSGETRTAGPEAHILIYDAGEAAMTGLTVTHGPEQEGTGKPSEYNERHFLGQTGVTVTISPTAQAAQGVTHTANWSGSGTLYGWTYNVVTGKLQKTHERIASYDHDTHYSTISGKVWFSSLDEYVAGREPTQGAEVVYQISAATEYSLTPAAPATTKGTNHIWASAGDVTAVYAYYDPVYATAKEQLSALNGSQYIYGTGENWITVLGVLDEAMTQSTGSVKAERKCPDMEYLVEDNNRLWGCHYGKGADGQMLNEIYACKLGDFRNWRVYQGISTDSYTVSIGSDGPFTGAASYGGMPMFFKKDCVHKIYGSQPSNFQVMTTKMHGVAPGSSRSLVNADGTLFYLSEYGVEAFDGSLPVRVSEALGEDPMLEGAAGAIGGRYYICVTEDGKKRLYVYDMQRNIWQEEDTEGVFMFAAMDGDLYMMGLHRIDTALGSAGRPEAKVCWHAETGLHGWEYNISQKVKGAADASYVTRFNLRAVMQQGSRMKCYLQYDSSGDWIKKLDVESFRAESSTRLMPVYPKRSDHIHIRLEGENEVKLHSIIRLITGGGDGKRG